MMNKKEITKFAREILHSQKGLKNRQLMHPKREWATGIVVALCIFIASITWSSIEYAKYKSIENQIVSQSEAPVAVYREALVTEALSEYAAKAQRLNVLLGGDVSIILLEDNSEPEGVDNEFEEESDDATTTESISSSSDIQITTESEGSTEIDTSPEGAAASSSESSVESTREEPVQSATNI
jgi:hypothetical protein